MERVLVGMSGGVDSAATTLLLQQEGYAVCGTTLVLHPYGACGENVAAAEKTAETIGIPFSVCHGEALFREAVLLPFAESYAAGETPNPCVFCNPRVKFALLQQEAKRLSATHLATGHYARVRHDGEGGRSYLCRAADETKDQTYALWGLGQEILQHLLLPMGEHRKSETRSFAEAHHLVPRGLAESQDICFVPDGDYAAFLQRELGVSSPEGDFTAPDGTVLGRHRGLIHYTVGQRRGLGISAEHRLFVLEKNAKQNRVVLGPPELLYARRMAVRGVHWQAIAAPQKSFSAEVKARYRQAAQPAVVTPTGEESCIVEFLTPQRALTPGQSAVFYQGDAMLGGGFLTAAGEEEKA